MYDYPSDMKPLESSLYSDPSNLKLRSLSSSLLDDFDSLARNLSKKVDIKHDDHNDGGDDSLRYSGNANNGDRNEYMNGRLTADNNFLSLDAPSVFKNSKQSRLSSDNNNNYIRLNNNNSNVLGNKLKVQQLIEKFESTPSENTLSFAYPGTYFCNDIKYKKEKFGTNNKSTTITLNKTSIPPNSSNQISDLILSKTISLQNSTEQWKKKINSNNFSDLPRNVNISERLDKLKVKDHLSNSLKNPKISGLQKSQKATISTLSRLELPYKSSKFNFFHKESNISPLSYASEPFSNTSPKNNRIEGFSPVINKVADGLSISPSVERETKNMKLSRKDKFKFINSSKKSLKSHSSTSSIFYTDLSEQWQQFNPSNIENQDSKENSVCLLSSVSNPLYSPLSKVSPPISTPQYFSEESECNGQRFCDTSPVTNTAAIPQQKPLGPKFFTNSNSLDIQREKIRIESFLSSPSGAPRSCLQRRKAFKVTQGSSSESQMSTIRSSYLDTLLKPRCVNEDDEDKEGMGFTNPIFRGSKIIKIKPKISRNKTWSQENYFSNKCNISENVCNDDNSEKDKITLKSEKMKIDDSSNEPFRISDNGAFKAAGLEMNEEINTINHINNLSKTPIKAYKNKNSLKLSMTKDPLHYPSPSSSSSSSSFYTPNTEDHVVLNKHDDSCTKNRSHYENKDISIRSNVTPSFQHSREGHWNNESNA